MALRATPGWLQGGSHTAEDDRLRQQAVFGSSGVLGTTQMQVQAQASPNMTVNVTAGWASILGTAQTNMGAYEVYNDATTILTITTANASLPRIDRIVVSVNDAFYTGNPAGTTANTVSFQVLAGTPAGSPTAPATPANSISLATVAVGAAVSNITSGNITDTRAISQTNLPVLSLNGGTMLGGITLTSGTATTAPLNLTAGTAGIVAGGKVDYDGTAIYAVPNSSATSTTNGGRAAVTASHYYYSATPNYTLSLTTAIQPALAASGSGIALAANTLYEVEGIYRIQMTAGTTATTLSQRLDYSGTSSESAFNFTTGSNNSGPTFSSSLFVQQTVPIASVAGLTPSITSTSVFATSQLKGFIRTTTAGTLVWNVVLNNITSVTAPAALVSFLKLTPVAAGANRTMGAWI
jgi:hypothetical protein